MEPDRRTATQSPVVELRAVREPTVEERLDVLAEGVAAAAASLAGLEQAVGGLARPSDVRALADRVDQYRVRARSEARALTERIDRLDTAVARAHDVLYLLGAAVEQMEATVERTATVVRTAVAERPAPAPPAAAPQPPSPETRAHELPAPPVQPQPLPPALLAGLEALLRTVDHRNDELAAVGRRLDALTALVAERLPAGEPRSPAVDLTEHVSRRLRQVSETARQLGSGVKEDMVVRRAKKR